MRRAGFGQLCVEGGQGVGRDGPGFSSPAGRLANYRPDALTVNTHTDDVKERDLVALNIDYGQMGVGGDNSWGARTHPEYSLLDDTYSYSFTMSIIK